MATKKEKMTKGRECVCVFAPKHQQHPTKRKEVEDKFSVRLCVCRPVYIIKDKKNGQKIETAAAAGVLSSRRQLPPYCDLFSKDEFASWQTK